MVLSALKTVLVRKPNSLCAQVNANRAVASIMFRAELEDLENHYLNRLTAVHILGAGSPGIDLFTGRLTLINEQRCSNTG